MKELRREVEIAAPAERVWSVLVDFDAYPDWNPFIRSIQGTCEPGAQLTVRIEPPGARGMTFKPKVLSVEPGRELAWLGRVLVAGVFDGEHRFSIEQLDGGRSRLVQSERFRGLLVPLFGKTLAATELGFDAMNEALKKRSEAAQPSP
ncbi:MAG: SRPBCC family protein, partial [Mycobacteriales bacterium]